MISMGVRPLLERRSRPRDPGIRCLACDRTLSFLPECHPFSLRCENAHRFTLRDLLDQAFPSNLRAGNDLGRSTLNAWESRARTLHAFSGSALRDGTRSRQRTSRGRPIASSDGGRAWRHSWPDPIRVFLLPIRRGSPTRARHLMPKTFVRNSLLSLARPPPDRYFSYLN
jgi:hypothetical protein